MRVEVRKAFLWAPDGIHVREVKVGEVLEGEGARHALLIGEGRQLDEPPPPPPADPPAEKALEGAPSNAALKPLRNKGR